MQNGLQGVPFIAQAARKYVGTERRRAWMRGLAEPFPLWTETQAYAPVPEDEARTLADIFDSYPHAPDAPEILASYRALSQELVFQWDALDSAGLIMIPHRGAGEPYANSADMLARVNATGILLFLPTDSAFGETGDTSDRAHPLLSPAPRTAQGHALLMNDVFRAVHDAFGHAVHGFQFGPRGEHNAWIAHARMFSPAAWLALAIETRAQNSWVNYGAHLRRPDGSLPRVGESDFVPLSARPFAPQKLVRLPFHLVTPPAEN